MISKKKYPLLLALLCMFIMLACNFPGLGNTLPFKREYSNPVNVKAELSENGAVQVTTAYWRGTEPQATLVCSYPGEDGASTLQHTYIDNEAATEASLSKYDDFAFIVKKPGTYTVTCSIGKYSTSGSFTIAEPVATPTTEPAAETPTTIPGAFELPKLGQFASAGLWYYFDTATSSVDNYFLAHCLPGVNYNDQGGYDYFSVAPNGELAGECSFAYGTSLILTGQFTEGKWTEDGKVTFVLETKAVSNSSSAEHPGTATSEIVWSGAGQFTSATQASGTATWTSVCTSSNPEWVPCAKPEFGSYVEADGTIQWIINFSP